MKKQHNLYKVTYITLPQQFEYEFYILADNFSQANNSAIEAIAELPNNVARTMKSIELVSDKLFNHYGD